MTRAATRANTAGAPIDVVALAAVRATREAKVRRVREELPCILGVPAAGEVLAGETFDGETEAAMFPGDLPDDPNDLFRATPHVSRHCHDRAAERRFSLPARAAAAAGDDGARHPTLPHIRLDRALQFLIGDRLQ